jgi:dTDP-4-amino-4,6-dideoxygalactose transaminase
VSGSAAAAVPFVDLRRQYRAIGAEMERAVVDVLRSQQYVLGPEVARFEEEIARHLAVPHAIGVSSGTDALLLALAALDVGRGDEVITSPFSFVATAAAVVRLGATPVFADIAPGDFLLDVDAVARAVTRRTRALLPVHLYGQCIEPGPFDALARAQRLPIVEDAAQAIGAARDGEHAGGFGDLACFSFYPTKNLSAAGDAGLVTTSDERLAARVRRLRDHGSERRYEHLEVGANARLDAIQAAVLRVKLRYLESWTEARIARARLYHALLHDAGLDTVLELPRFAADSRHVFHQYVVRAPRRDELRRHMASLGVASEVYYPVPLHLQPCFADLGYRRGDLPEAERAAGEALALPIFPEIERDEQERVVRALASFYGA